MSTHKWIDRICAAAVALSVVLMAVFMGGEALGIQPAGSYIGYENRLFDSSRVHTIDIVMDDWDGFIETCQSEEYSACSVVIDGESYKNVGIRGKGNTSLSSVATMGSSRYSFKIEFDKYDGTKSYHGLDKLSLNNLIQDNTMMKDYLTYRMMGEFGIAAPLCSFVYITVNGEDWGLYLAVEGVEEAFLQRNYGSDYGELYKPDSMSFGGGRGNGRDFNMNDFAEMPSSSGESNPFEQGGGFDFGGFGGKGGFGGGGGFGGASDVKLQYIDDDPSSYSNIFDNAKTDVSDADKSRLISSLESLYEYADLESVLDIDAVLRYFVVHGFAVNGDSYTGSMIHNYYLYEEDGRLSMIPWDYNLAFGTFSGGAAASAVNDAIDDALSDRPMQAWIFTSEEYTERYHELYAEFLDSVDAARIIDDAYALIADYVERDPTKFCTYDEFETGVRALKSFCELRQESVRGQLDGSIPSTSEGQTDSASLVNADSLNLSDMGTMNSGRGFAAPGGGGEQPSEGMTPPTQGGQSTEGMTPPTQSGQLPEGMTPPTQSEQPSEGGQSSGDASRAAGRFGGGDFSLPGGEWGGSTPSGQSTTDGSTSGLVLLGVSALALAVGLLIAFKYKKW